MKAQNTIMIIDDEPDNLKILESMLYQEGFIIAAFPEGEMALKAALKNPPDLLLLDIRMPAMDGFTLCKIFKKNKLLKDVPIIFLSALSDLSDKVKAFDLGGVDYITKPFSEKEVIVRIRTHLQLREYQLHLEETVRERTKKLSDAYKRLKIWDDTKSMWMNMLAHEIRTPLNGLFGATQLLLVQTPDSDSVLKKLMYSSMNRINKLIDDAMIMVQIKVNSSVFFSKLMDVNLQSCIREMLPGINSSDIPIEFCQKPDLDLKTHADYNLIYRAIKEIIITATKCLLPGNKLIIEMNKQDKFQWILFNGVGNLLNDNDMSTFFSPFGQQTLYKEEADFGLGPALAKSIINIFQGSVYVKNVKEQNKFVIEVCFPVDSNKKNDC
jgi:two-component system sensor histidine kinase/response regulator